MQRWSRLKAFEDITDRLHDLDDTELRVILVLVRHADAEGCCDLSETEIAALIGAEDD